MNIADVLRRLADTVDKHSQGGSPDPGIQNPAELITVNTGQYPVTIKPEQDKPSPNGTTASGNDQNPEDLFLPPLQQKQELLKKAVGVENVYDDGRPGDAPCSEEIDDQESDKRQDIVDRIKRLSGIPTAAIQELSNDEVFDD